MSDYINRNPRETLDAQPGERELGKWMRTVETMDAADKAARCRGTDPGPATAAAQRAIGRVLQARRGTA